MLIAFEGLDQSGKETQAQQLRERLRETGRKVRLLSFPDYGTSIGEEIARALAGERDYGADVMQLLFVANRHERREAIIEWLNGGLILVCDRYRASSIAYGEARASTPAGSNRFSRCCPPRISRSSWTSTRKQLPAGRRTTATSTSATSRC
jgi:dTMP kinase